MIIKSNKAFSDMRALGYAPEAAREAASALAVAEEGEVLYLPTAGGWGAAGLPTPVSRRHFVWRWVATWGTGNAGRWVPAGTQAAKALFAWFRAQTSVPFYGEYWWDAIIAFNPLGLDEIAEAILRARAQGIEFPSSRAAAARINSRLGSLSGPRMWAMVEAVAPRKTWSGCRA